MASFDKSFYDLLNRYSSINEQQQPSPELMAMFRKLHGSNYTPGAMNDAKMNQLRTAGVQVGGFNDVEKVRNAAYAQQYAGTPQGAAYAKKAGIAPTSSNAGVTPGRPGEPASAGTQDDINAQATGVPAGTTPAQFDARRAAQTGTARPVPNKRMMLGGQGDMPARTFDFNTGQSTPVPEARPVFKGANPATPGEQATGVPAGTTPAQFDARRAAQTGTARPVTSSTATRPTNTPASGSTAATAPSSSGPRGRGSSAPRRNRGNA